MSLTPDIIKMTADKTPADKIYTQLTNKNVIDDFMTICIKTIGNKY